LLYSSKTKESIIQEGIAAAACDRDGDGVVVADTVVEEAEVEEEGWDGVEDGGELMMVVVNLLSALI
jgi:hypothetical protein